MDVNNTGKADENLPPPPGPEVAAGLDHLEQGLEPEPDAQPGGPGPFEVLPPAHPWREWVDLGLVVVKGVANNWEWPEQGTQMFRDGIEKQLTIWMPNGLIDLEKYPVLGALIGLGMIVLANMEEVEVNGELRHKVKRLSKPKLAPKKPAAEAELRVEEGSLATRSAGKAQT